MPSRIHPKALVEAAVEASYYLRPNDPGLTLAELIDVGERLSSKKGEISDAVQESEDLEPLAGGRYGLVPNRPHLYLHIEMPWPGSPRKPDVYDNIAFAIRDHLATHGKAHKTINTDFIFSTVADPQHDVAVELAMMRLNGLFITSGSTITLTDLGVGHFREFDGVSRAGPRISRPDFPDILSVVRLVLDTRIETLSPLVKPKAQSAMTRSATNKSGIFFSHASADSLVTNDFVEHILQLGIGVPSDEIFNVSNPDQGVRGGQYFIPYIRERVQKSAVVIAWITPRFRIRPFCMAELGAAWALLPDSFFPVLHEVTYDQLDGVLDGMQVYVANKRPDMDRLRDDVVKALSLQATQKSATWDKQREAFFRKHM